MTNTEKKPDLPGKTDERDKKGRFTSNQTSPGRRKGSKNKLAPSVRALVAADAEEIVKAMIIKAKSGNAHCGAALLRLVCAPLRETADPIMIDLAAISTPSEAAAAISTVIAATTAGKLSPDAAKDVVNMIAMLSKAIETVDLEKRLSTIEETIKKSKV